MPKTKYGQTFKKRDWTEQRAKVDDEGRCRSCGRTNGTLDASHVVPRSVSHGGGHGADDIIPQCRPCHSYYEGHDLDIGHTLTLDEQHAALNAAGSIDSLHRRVYPKLWKKLDSLAVDLQRSEERSQRLSEALEEICAGNYLETDSDVDPLFPERAIAERALNDRTGDPLPW